MRKIIRKLMTNDNKHKTKAIYRIDEKKDPTIKLRLKKNGNEFTKNKKDREWYLHSLCVVHLLDGLLSTRTIHKRHKSTAWNILQITLIYQGLQLTVITKHNTYMQYKRSEDNNGRPRWVSKKSCMSILLDWFDLQIMSKVFTRNKAWLFWTKH